MVPLKKIHKGDIFFFLAEVISKLPQVSLGIQKPSTGGLTNRLILQHRSNCVNTAQPSNHMRHLYTFNGPVKSSTVSVEKVSQWAQLIPQFLPTGYVALAFA